MLEERVGRASHRFARICDHQLGNRELERTLDDERDSSPGHGLRRKVVTVSLQAGDADEERSRADSPRVVSKVGDIGGGGVESALGAHGAAQEVELDDA